MDRPCREMTFAEEAKFYEEEARAEFAKETGNDDSAGVNNILRRGMRIIRKARQEIASRVEVVRCKDCRYWDDDRRCNGIENGLMREYTKPDDYCSYGERKDDV